MKLNRFWKALVAIAIVVWSTNAASAQPQIVTDGLISFWSLDMSSISGDTVKDIWGDNHGAVVGNPEIVAGKINEALAFDGQDDLVEIAHSESLNLEEAITIEFWFLLKGDSSDNEYPRPVSKGQTAGADGAYGVWIRDTRSPIDIGFRSVTLVPNNIQWKNLPDYNDDAWHHVAVTYDGQKGKLYVDGVNYTDLPVSGDLAQTEDPLHIGDGNNQRHFNGALDEVRIYNRALDENEVLQNYNAKSNDRAVDAKFKLTTTWGGIKSGY